MRPFWVRWSGKTRRRREAFRLLWRNEIADARRLLERDNAAFELACVELEAGDYDAARDWTRSLPNDPACDVLEGLIALRATQSPYRAGSSWLDALLAAWRAGGRPDLNANPHLDTGFGGFWDRGLPSQSMNETERAMWMWMTQCSCIGCSVGPSKANKARAVRQWATAIARGAPELAELQVAFFVLSGAEKERVFQQLRERVPDNVHIRLASYTRNPQFALPDVLDNVDLKALDHISNASTVNRYLGDSMFDRLEQAAAKAGSHSPGLMAYLKGVKVEITGQLEVKRFNETKGSNRKIAAKSYAKIGRLLQQDGYLKSFSHGRQLLHLAAAELDDEQLRNELREQEAQTKFLHGSNSRWIGSVLSWPIPSLYREVNARLRANEVRFFFQDCQRQAETA